jgi:hypothetical protein
LLPNETVFGVQFSRQLHTLFRSGGCKHLKAQLLQKQPQNPLVMRIIFYSDNGFHPEISKHNVTI